MNEYIFSGNLTDAPTTGKVSSYNYAKFTVAVDRYRKGGTKSAIFIPVVAWGTVADASARYLTKGSKVLIKGTPDVKTVKDDDGNNKTYFSVRAEFVEFISSTESVKNDRGDYGDDFNTNTPPEDEDMPF